MLRRSRYVPALAIAACGLIAAAVSAPPSFLASASTSPAGTVSTAGTIAAGQPPTAVCDLHLLARPGLGRAAG